MTVFSFRKAIGVLKSAFKKKAPPPRVLTPEEERWVYAMTDLEMVKVGLPTQGQLKQMEDDSKRYLEELYQMQKDLAAAGAKLEHCIHVNKQVKQVYRGVSKRTKVLASPLKPRVSRPPGGSAS